MLTYKEYCENNYKKTGFEMYVKRFDKLIENFNSGYDNLHLPVVNKNNILMDGQHRCCLLLHKYGGDYEIETIKIVYI